MPAYQKTLKISAAESMQEFLTRKYCICQPGLLVRATSGREKPVAAEAAPTTVDIQNIKGEVP
jgi:hypothetical protein